jgi:hypothetical protein
MKMLFRQKTAVEPEKNPVAAASPENLSHLADSLEGQKFFTTRLNGGGSR